MAMTIREKADTVGSLRHVSASLLAARYPPRPMAIAPAASSATPATRITRELATAPERPAARAKGTVRPSDIPRTTSRTVSEPEKWASTW